MVLSIIAKEEIELKELANQINNSYRDAGLRFKKSLEDICTIGDLLHDAKDKVKRQRLNWVDWVNDNLDIKIAQVNRYMKVSINKYELLKNDTTGSFSNLSLTGAMKQLSISNIDNPVLYTSSTDEWYTPDLVVQRVCKTMGGIDLDPCSNIGGSPSIPASTYYTNEDDGLVQQWFGRVYMNPPYGRVILDWVKKLNNEYASGRVTEAVALVPSRTDTEWFFILRNYLKCFVRGRLKFSGNGTAAPFPSVAVYLGENEAKFISSFKDIGDVYRLCS